MLDSNGKDLQLGIFWRRGLVFQETNNSPKTNISTLQVDELALASLSGALQTSLQMDKYPLF
jgi:hypothetical protein